MKSFDTQLQDFTTIYLYLNEQEQYFFFRK